MSSGNHYFAGFDALNEAMSMDRVRTHDAPPQTAAIPGFRTYDTVAQATTTVPGFRTYDTVPQAASFPGFRTYDTVPGFRTYDTIPKAAALPRFRTYDTVPEPAALPHSRTNDASPKVAEFPQFPDADVHIIITGSRQYKLHSTILKSVSATLREQLGCVQPAKLSSAVRKRGVNIRYYLRMVPNPIPPTDESKLQYVLEPVQVNESGKPVDGSHVKLDLENGRSVHPNFLVRPQCLLLIRSVLIASDRLTMLCWVRSTTSRWTWVLSRAAASTIF